LHINHSEVSATDISDGDQKQSRQVGLAGKVDRPQILCHCQLSCRSGTAENDTGDRISNLLAG
jgi:hypothetical protein